MGGAAITEEPRLSIVVPTLDEERSIVDLLGDLAPLAVPHEIIVADGGSSDATRERAREFGASVIDAQRGRGPQLAAGAAASRASMLCFLHADVRADRYVLRALREAAACGQDTAWVFNLRIDDPGVVFRVVEWGANARTRWFDLPYGDQGLIVSRAAYLAAGGFPLLPMMEDVVLARALRRVVPLKLIDTPLHVSSRRWRREGIVLRTLHNWLLISAFLAGVPAERLAGRYKPSGDNAGASGGRPGR
ncbi:MAG: TIGR04283 family arsenosugar biosynthesis glycosyltransferase [Gemmatimonadaceae bacterium]